VQQLDKLSLLHIVCLTFHMQEGFEGEQALMWIKEVMSFLGCCFYQELGWVISMQVFKAFTHVERWSR
jgi:hypothetical protein